MGGSKHTFHFRILLLFIAYQFSGTRGSKPLTSAYAMKYALRTLSSFHFSFTIIVGELLLSFCLHSPSLIQLTSWRGVGGVTYKEQIWRTQRRLRGTKN